MNQWEVREKENYNKEKKNKPKEIIQERRVESTKGNIIIRDKNIERKR